MTLSYLPVKKTRSSENGGEWHVADREMLWSILMLLVLHIPLGLLLYHFSDLSTIHAIAVLAVGLLFVFTGRLQYAAYVVAYIVGAEVLWRMTHASIFWEFGKYSVSLLVLLATLRGGNIRNPGLPLLYFLLLVPSSILTVENLSGSVARDQLSFNLSGPFALTACMLFFSGRRITFRELHRLFFFVMAPIFSITTIAVFRTVSAPKIYFGDDSVSVTSGGYGPNQVSAVLGFAALACFLYLVSRTGRKGLKGVTFLFMIAFGVQSALTFSRGGLYLASAAAVTAAIFLARDFRTIFRYAIVGAVVAGLAVFLIWPRLQAFTGGAIQTRFEDTGTTGRLSIIKDDLRIWNDNFIMGVGPGRAKAFRYLFRGIAAHTELTRMLAEHGLPGLFAICLLLVMAVRSVLRNHNTEARALSTCLVVWSVCYMVVNAMRLVAPAFLFALASADLGEEESAETVEKSQLVLRA